MRLEAADGVWRLRQVGERAAGEEVSAQLQGQRDRAHQDQEEAVEPQQPTGTAEAQNGAGRIGQRGGVHRRGPGRLG
jgi:hypothetical protein